MSSLKQLHVFIMPTVKCLLLFLVSMIRSLTMTDIESKTF